MKSSGDRTWGCLVGLPMLQSAISGAISRKTLRTEHQWIEYIGILWLPVLLRRNGSGTPQRSFLRNPNALFCKACSPRTVLCVMSMKSSANCAKMVPSHSQNSAKIMPKLLQIPWRLLGTTRLQDAEVGGKIDPRWAKSCQLGAKMG